MSLNVEKKEKFHLYTILFMAYYLIAPMEDVLKTSFGTVAKYIALAILLVGLIETRGNLFLKINGENVCIILLIIVSVSSCLWAIDQDTALSRIVAYVLLPGLCLFSGMLSFSKREFNAIIFAAILGGLLTVVYIGATNILETISDTRLELNEKNDPNNLAALLILPLFLAVKRLLDKSVKLRKPFYIVVIALLGVFVLLTGSRGALLACILATVCYLLFSKSYRKLGNLLLIFIVAIVLLFLIHLVIPDTIFARLFEAESYLDTINSENNRVAIWRYAFKNIVSEMPLYGIGAGCVPLELKYGFGGVEKAMHNTYLNMLCEFGIIALPIFLVLLGVLMKKTLRRKNFVEAALLVAICVVIFFLNSYAKKFFWNVIMLLFIQQRVLASDDSALGDK